MSYEDQLAIIRFCRPGRYRECVLALTLSPVSTSAV